MNKFRIIWIDDAWKEESALPIISKDIYDHLINNDILIEWIKVFSISEGMAKLETEKDISLVFLDYNFEGDSFTFYQIFSKSQKSSLPFLILTNYLGDVIKDDAILNELVRNMKFLGIFSKEPEERIKLLSKLEFFFKSPPVKILHLSDIHYNSKLTGKEKENQENMFNSLLEVIIESHDNLPIDFVVISGDLSSENPTEDLASMELILFLRKLIYSTIRDINKLILVPGNHDIQWINFKKKILAKNPWGAYLGFLSNIYNQNISIQKEMKCFDVSSETLNTACNSSNIFFNRKNKDLGVDFIGFSSIQQNPKDQGKGVFYNIFRKNIEEFWKKNDNSLRICVFHHNIFSVLSYNSVDEGEIISNSGGLLFSLLSNKCNLILNGHTHNPNIFKISGYDFGLDGYELEDRELVISSTGTMGGTSNSKKLTNTFHIIEYFPVLDKKFIITPYAMDPNNFNWKERNRKNI